MEVKIINITLQPKGKKPDLKMRLEEKVREVAYNCSEEVWWNPSLDAARALQRAMQTLADHGEYDRAMDILTALYDIVDLDMGQITLYSSKDVSQAVDIFSSC